MGGVRTALYCYLFTKQNNGEFILRIEDTDQKRYVAEAEEYINNALAWCGIEVAEGVKEGGNHGPYRQSERLHLYKPYADQLIASGNAYYAFDTSEELNALRERLQNEGSSVQSYAAATRMGMRNSLTLSEEETQTLLTNGTPYVIRMKIPENESIRFTDRIRGEVVFDSNQLDDKVLLKADGFPTYHMANVIDDHLMEISHVIRGEEWLPSTPLHVLLYDKLGWKESMPEFAHLPLILKPEGKAYFDEDKKALVDGYKEMGFSAAAFINFLALLGWNGGTEQEIFSMEELIKQFSLERVSKSGARFDFDKAKWFNQQYLKNIANEIIVENLKKHENASAYTDGLIDQLLPIFKERLTFPNDFWDQSRFFVAEIEIPADKSIRKKWSPELKSHFESLKDEIASLTNFDSTTIEETIKKYIESNSLKFGDVLLPMRLMISGVKGGPSLFDIAAILGKEKVIDRLEKGFVACDAIVAAA
ncbi:UNVERIFIED_CONTAM: hypothetical protein GTU68_008464 [Idotea baltica]|nr:hypothetical protein [Idotea baltica]